MCAWSISLCPILVEVTTSHKWSYSKDFCHQYIAKESSQLWQVKDKIHYRQLINILPVNKRKMPILRNWEEGQRTELNANEEWGKRHNTHARKWQWCHFFQQALKNEMDPRIQLTHQICQGHKQFLSQSMDDSLHQHVPAKCLSPSTRDCQVDLWIKWEIVYVPLHVSQDNNIWMACTWTH